MSDETDIPQERRERNPLITEAGFARLERITMSPHAPRWNFEVGDRLEAGDVAQVDAFRADVFAPRVEGARTCPPPHILEWVAAMRARSSSFSDRIGAPQSPVAIGQSWAHVEPMSREVLAARLETVVPIDADLDRIIAFDTSGTTGHAVQVPFHPLTLAKAHVLADYVLAQYGVRPDYGPHMTACLNVCAQKRTYAFANVFSVWNQAGFAKVNLSEAEWPGAPGSTPGSTPGSDPRQRARAFFKELAPAFITSNPVALAEMIRWEIDVRPRAIMSTSMTLGPALKASLESYFGCPVIDWYSITETGPIAYAAPDGRGMCITAPDIYVEAIGPDGHPVPDGQWGELAVTGGRNPFIPLLRYRTGDRGRMEGGRIMEFEGRNAVSFRATDGSTVNEVDIGRIMRLHVAFVQHSFVQRADGACEVVIRPAPGAVVDKNLVASLLKSLFGTDQELTVEIDPQLGAGGKVIPYRSEM